VSTIIKSFSVGNGDMFYIKHGSSNFSIIDCDINEDDKENIVHEINSQRKGKEITRFISTHPDEDHLHGLKYLDEKIDILNFYCVENNAVEDNPTEDFDHYCELRDGNHHYYVEAGCSRKWMNKNDVNDGKNYGSSGINFIWPVTANDDYKDALIQAENGVAFNNISPIFTYEQKNGIKAMWMGDLEQDFTEKIKDEVKWPRVDILFAPHHGRSSGKVPSDILKKIDPKIIIIGEALSKELDYYNGYNTLKQNTAKDIVFECDEDRVHVYISSNSYSYDTSFLENDNKKNNEYGNYIGSLGVGD